MIEPSARAFSIQVDTPDKEKRLGKPDTIAKLATAISQAVHDFIMNP